MRLAIVASEVSGEIENGGTEGGRSSSEDRRLSPFQGDVVPPPHASAEGSGPIRTQPWRAHADSRHVEIGELRPRLGRWFGYNPRWHRLLDEVESALASHHHLLISAPPGAALDELSTLLRGLNNDQRVVRFRADSKALDDGALRDVSHSRHPFVIIVEQRQPLLSTLGETAVDIPFVRVPRIKERRDDLARLISEARHRAQQDLHLDHAPILADMKALYSYAWPGHLDELDEVMRMVVGLRATGSLRRAAAVLDMKKTTLAAHLHAVGIDVKQADD